MPPGDFLINSHHLDLGSRTRKGPINDVELPQWATDAADFIEKVSPRACRLFLRLTWG